jgi:O-antigen ligase
MAARTESLIGSVLLVGLIATSTFVTPWNNLEPVGLPKLAVLTLTVSLAGALFLLFHKFPSKFPSLFFHSTLVAIALSLINILINNQFVSERIFGIQGRNFGALTLICLLITSMMSLSVSEKLNPIKIIIAIKLSSFLVAIYFIAQLQGLDRAAWVDAYGGIPSSTLGNPNFVSAFVSIGFVSTLPLLLARQTKWRMRTIIFSVSTLELYVSVESNSFQGLAIMLFGFFYIALGFLRPVLQVLKKSSLVAFFTFTMLITGFTFYKFQDLLSINNATIQARIDYWEAGLAMGLHSPIFGRGFDYFGESYLMFRSERAAVRSPGLFTDSAHNYFIDLFAFGGFPLLFSVFLPFFLVFQLKLKTLLQDLAPSKKNPLNVSVNRGLFLAWFGFVFQAMLSPICISLAYLGFLLTGFLFGNLNRMSKSIKNSPPRKLRRVSRGLLFSTFFSKEFLLRFILTPMFLLLPFLGFQPLIADAKFRDAIEQGNGDALIEIALRQPKNYSRMHNAVEIYKSNSLDDLALKITRVMVKENPENIRGWRLLERTSSNELEKELARSKIRDLDPKNPELGKKQDR